MTSSHLFADQLSPCTIDLLVNTPEFGDEHDNNKVL
jgi:hypothetical protein